MKFFKEKLEKITLPALALIIIGSLSWSLTMVKSGLTYSYGVGFWGPNGHDGVWHIALTQSLVKGTWQMPIFAGETLKNYHIGFDLLLAMLNKFTLIPISTLYFQVLPPVLALSIGLFVYWFTFDWTKSGRSAFWATFFVYFGGGWGWLVTLVKTGQLGGESIFWSQQSVSTLVNPPFALSLALILLGLIFLRTGLKTKDKRLLIAATFLFGILVQVKIYAGILVLIGLLSASIWRIAKRQGLTLVKIFTGALVISILIFSPVTENAAKTIIFKPFWFLETMFEFQDRVGWQKFGEAMINYKLAGNPFKGIPAYALAFLLFWFGNLGTRVVKEIKFIKDLRNLKRLGYLDIFCYSIIFSGIIFPLLFIQSGTPWNTIQFMYYSLFFSGILAGIAGGKYLDSHDTTLLYSNVVKRIVVCGVIILTLPTTIGTLWYNYLPGRPPAKISTEELKALSFLSKEASGIVLTQPFDRDAANAAVDNPPRPLYLYESSAYVSAFSGKPTYLEDEVNLEITGYDWQERRQKEEEFFAKPDINFLVENRISYVYLLKNAPAVNNLENIGLKKILENSEIMIFKLYN